MSAKTELINFFEELGKLSKFSLKTFSEFSFKEFELREFTRQCFTIGYKSLPLTGITAFIMGLVITIQAKPTLVEFGAEAWLPKLSSLSMIREICPVITALICAGKVGSGIGAELGSMKVTEQIDAMEVSGTNPFRFLVITRILATTLTLPILVVFGDGISLIGSWMGDNLKGHISWPLFRNQVFETLTYGDLIPSILKSFFFGFTIGAIGCYKGFNTSTGTEGVGRAANSSVVVASLIVFIIDFIAVQISDLLNLT
ncbi:MAG: MlaE family ABC transporter permease [Bacteroidota bacterium]|jgi:phospholipid/cholesterol/gamma-HCH transport system permease protein